MTATMTADKPVRPFGEGLKPAPKPRQRKATRPAARDGCAMFLAIRGTVYRVNRLRIQDPEIVRAFRLRHEDGRTVHDVHHDAHGSHCTCGDQCFRHEGVDNLGCKHIRALRAWGQLPAADLP